MDNVVSTNRGRLCDRLAGSRESLGATLRSLSIVVLVASGFLGMTGVASKEWGAGDICEGKPGAVFCVSLLTDA